jgi:hypothetical protein
MADGDGQAEQAGNQPSTTDGDVLESEAFLKGIKVLENYPLHFDGVKSRQS